MKTNATRSHCRTRSLQICFILAAALLLAHPALAENVTLAWDPNSEADLAGYRIHYGTRSGSYTSNQDVGNVTTCVVDDLSAGVTYYFAATAYDASGNQSGYSSEVSYSVPAPNTNPSTPARPVGASSGWVGTAYAFATSATDPNGDGIEYRFDWGGGSTSSWGAATRSNTWSTAGRYTVKAQARDSFGALSGWSSGRTITIAQAEAPAADSGSGQSEAPAAGSSGDGAAGGSPAPGDAGQGGSGGGSPGVDQPPADDSSQGSSGDSSPALNQPPDAPIQLSPINDEVTDSTPALRTEYFYDPDAGDTHAETRWQIFRDSDSTCVLDVKTASGLTSLNVPKLILEPQTTYFWRAQFFDGHSAGSEWSDYAYFDTDTVSTDLNENGIPDSQEVGPRLDLDHNGVKDNKQNDLKAVAVERSRVQIGVSIAGCATASAIEALESEDPDRVGSNAAGKPKKMPFGLLNFRIRVAQPGDEAVVRLYFSKAAPTRSRWYKYDPVAGAWYDFSAYAAFNARRTSVTLRLRDGGEGDADGIANGVIVDPAGLGVADVDFEDLVSGAGGGGCFIAAAAAARPAGSPNNKEIGILCLLLCAGGIGLARASRRRG